ncbi:MAG: hypothetical protein OEZ54_01260 [Gemmatimonadota bacterium]|nr:hypothetical protein [Gemmatimonadota bacterium]
MPSDKLKEQALDVVMTRAEGFRSSVVEAVEQLRTFLDAQQTSKEGVADRLRIEFGRLAEDKIDFDRFSAIFADPVSLDPVGVEQVEFAYSVLSKMAESPDEQFFAQCGEDESLVAVVDQALGLLGRTFGAARISELSRNGRFKESIHGTWLSRFPFSRWNSTERRMAPPLVVSVPGSRFRPATLADYIDGGVKIIFLVDEPCPPAALARLITPSTMVVQTYSVEGLDRFAEWNGSGVAAVVPQSAAEFVHDPKGGNHLADRLILGNVPKPESIRALSGASAAQQRDELDLLLSLADTSKTVISSGETGEAADENAEPELADKLAAWLLNRAGLPGAG